MKAVLRACIGRVEYDPDKNRARAGFLRLPTRAHISKLAPESARIRVVAGARSAITPRPPEGLVLAFTVEPDGVLDAAL